MNRRRPDLQVNTTRRVSVDAVSEDLGRIVAEPAAATYTVYSPANAIILGPNPATIEGLLDGTVSYSRIYADLSGAATATLGEGYRVDFTWRPLGSAVGAFVTSTVIYDVVAREWRPHVTLADLRNLYPSISFRLSKQGQWFEPNINAEQMAAIHISNAQDVLDQWIRSIVRETRGVARVSLIFDNAMLDKVLVRLALAGALDGDGQTDLGAPWLNFAKEEWKNIRLVPYDADGDGDADTDVKSPDRTRQVQEGLLSFR